MRAPRATVSRIAVRLAFGLEALARHETDRNRLDHLDLFARNPGRTLSRNDILEEVWGLETDPTPRTVDNFIVRLRKLFEPDPARPRYLVTVRAAGYRYQPDSREE